jgi:signal transduction histidine kinase
VTETTLDEIVGDTGGCQAATRCRARRAAGEAVMTLLIADDSPVNLALLRAQLEAEGHDVIEASNGVEALEALKQASVDAVISDILMPRMDGYRLCRDIRKGAKPNAGVPIVLYTATYSSAADRQLAEIVGADCYLIKPAPIAAILSAVKEAQSKSKQRQVSPSETSDDSYVLEQYNVALVRKLEDRNNELHDALATLNRAQKRMLELNRSLEIRVEQRTAALRATNHELEAFSYSVSHDLRAPLCTIEGFAQLLDASVGPHLIPEHRQHLENIVSSTKKMGLIIEALLKFARTSNADLDLVEVDLDGLLHGALVATRADASGRHIQWRQSHLPKALGDAVLLQQVFVNLLANAIKYTRTRDPAVIEIGSRKGRQHEVVVFVRDNGIGFDMQHAHKLFGPFQRLHRSSQFEGTGIGLASAHRIVTRLGGAIWAEAAIGRGATFYFSLPIADGP